jgi:hypothetical protein
MITKRTARFIDFVEKDGVRKSCEYLELDVDTVAELPDGEYEGIVIAHGTIAHIVSTGEFYALGGDGKWYNQDGSDAPNTVQTSQAAPLNMVSPTVIIPQTQLNTVQFEPKDDKQDDIDIEEVSADAENERGVESE